MNMMLKRGAVHKAGQQRGRWVTSGTAPCDLGAVQGRLLTLGGRGSCLLPNQVHYAVRAIAAEAASAVARMALQARAKAHHL
jgi:hypothetical protein